MNTCLRDALIVGLPLILACVVGCGPPGYIKETQKFADRVKTVVKPDELQTWATNLIAKTPTPPVRQNATSLKQTDIPDYIRAIDKEQPPDVYVSNWGDAVIVEIWYG